MIIFQWPDVNWCKISPTFRSLSTSTSRSRSSATSWSTLERAETHRSSGRKFEEFVVNVWKDASKQIRKFCHKLKGKIRFCIFYSIKDGDHKTLRLNKLRIYNYCKILTLNFDINLKTLWFMAKWPYIF